MVQFFSSTIAKSVVPQMPSLALTQWVTLLHGDEHSNTIERKREREREREKRKIKVTLSLKSLEENNS